MSFGETLSFMGDDGEPFEVDASLWVVRRPGQRGYILGSSHTFPGRFELYLPDQDYDVAVSRTELDDMSPQARIWIDGFLAGNEPPLYAYLGLERGPDPGTTDAEWHRWLRFCRRFRRDGSCPPLHPRPRRPLYLTEDERSDVRMEPFEPWAIAGERVWVPAGSTWVEADPQPTYGGGFAPGSVCGERGHCDIEYLDDDWHLCLDCGEAIDDS